MSPKINLLIVLITLLSYSFTACVQPDGRMVASVDESGDKQLPVPHISGPYMKDTSTTDFMWKFFNRHPMPESDSTLKLGSRNMMPESDAIRNESGAGQLFEAIDVPGLTNFQQGTNGAAFADLNHDGLLDVVTVTTPPFDLATEGDEVRDRLRFLINQGGFRFESHRITLKGSGATPEDFGQGWRGSQIPSLADFNDDGLLDLFVSRQCPCRHGEVRDGFTARGNSLFISDGSFYTLVDGSEVMGIKNKRAYNRQPSLGDLNRDGFIDIAVGADNTTSAFEGIPKSVLYVFKPNNGQFENGHFEDIGGTELIPDFGGFYRNDDRDKAGPNLAFRDMDNDGDLDLLQSTHVLINGRWDARKLPLSPVLYRQGIFTWKNMFEETGDFRFVKSEANGLADEAQLRYSKEQGLYIPATSARAPGLAYLLTADVTNNGFYDVITVDASDKTFTPKTEDIGGGFWYNRGDFQFEVATDAANLQSLNDSYEDWYAFFDIPVPAELKREILPTPFLPAQPGLDPFRPIDLRPYHADVVFADFNNDTWMDFVLLDRRESESIETHAVLYMNRGRGVFEPVETSVSGIDGTGIAGEAVDLNNDGRVDLFVSGDPDNSAVEGRKDDLARYEDKVFMNTGQLGSSNHWLRFRFSGISDAELIGARVEIFDPESGRRLGTRGIYTNHSYKTSSPLEAHFGLGAAERVDVVVHLPGKEPLTFEAVQGDRYLDLNVAEQMIYEVQSVSGGCSDEEDPGNGPGGSIAFDLRGNAPNPFQNATKILIDLPQPADVQVTVYDVLGRQVKTVSEALESGREQTIPLALQGLASGLYLYRVQAEGADGTTWMATGSAVLVR